MHGLHMDRDDFHTPALKYQSVRTAGSPSAFVFGRGGFGDVDGLLQSSAKVDSPLLDHLPDVFDPVLFVLDTGSLRKDASTGQKGHGDENPSDCPPPSTRELTTQSDYCNYVVVLNPHMSHLICGPAGESRLRLQTD